MIQNALDETLTNTGRLYVLYDDVGKLCLRDINKMKLDLVVDAVSTAKPIIRSGSITKTTRPASGNCMW